MIKVAVVKADEYKYAEEAVRKSIDLLGGTEKFLKPGWKVLLKPNLLKGAAPEKCVTTHPSIVRAVITIVREAGCTPVIGDSPGTGNSKWHSKKAGFQQVCEEMEVEWVDFENDIIEVKDKTAFKNLTIASAVMNADAVINLPKVKTHGQIYLTLAVKNMFGIVPGIRKAQWHLSSGKDLENFCKMLVEICYIKKPVLNIVDGITAMDGNGPGSGDPYQLGFIIAGEDPAAVDRTICDILRLKPSKVPTFKAAESLNLGVTDLSHIDIVGDDYSLAKVEDFKFTGQYLPGDMSSHPLVAGMIEMMKGGLTSKPWIDHETCTQCGQCVDHCPAVAMSLQKIGSNEKEKVIIDYDPCIRCYCCNEICPEGAISVKQGWMWKFVPDSFR